MKNPYAILNIKQDAEKNEIHKAKMKAMVEKKHPISAIAMATRQLLDPAKRLAADFMYPSKIQSKRPPNKLTIDVKVPTIDLNQIDENALDSLK